MVDLKVDSGVALQTEGANSSTFPLNEVSACTQLRSRLLSYVQENKQSVITSGVEGDKWHTFAITPPNLPNRQLIVQVPDTSNPSDSPVEIINFYPSNTDTSNPERIIELYPDNTICLLTVNPEGLSLEIPLNPRDRQTLFDSITTGTIGSLPAVVPSNSDVSTINGSDLSQNGLDTVKTINQLSFQKSLGDDSTRPQIIEKEINPDSVASAVDAINQADTILRDSLNLQIASDRSSNDSPTVLPANEATQAKEALDRIQQQNLRPGEKINTVLPPRPEFNHDQFLQNPLLAWDYARLTPDEPTPEDLNHLLELATFSKDGISDDFFVRSVAVDILGRLKFSPTQFQTIANNDPDAVIRKKAQTWIDHYDSQLFKYRLVHDPVYQSNPFGTSHDSIEDSPVKAVIAEIDTNGINDQVMMIGLSERQIGNLGLELNETLQSIAIAPQLRDDSTSRLSRGLLPLEQYGKVVVRNGSVQQLAIVYIARDEFEIPGCGIRISEALSHALQVKSFEDITLEKAA